MASLPKPVVTGSPVTWRPMTTGDIGYIAVLEAQIHAAPWTQTNFSDALATGYYALVGEREHRVVAYGILMLAPGEAQVLNLSVVPDQRRAGLGRALLRRFLDVARERGAEQCFLEVRTTNIAALALYAAEGFGAVGRREGYYPATARLPREDALVLRRALSAAEPFG
ncbi:MAG: ribosomal protein S18-alanine N-acetyltransferase [Proteobacteria bacterium]|nr:ribosomal protein S18-alanine N-acetyltransferase [Pseudomonadota bacterium]